MSVSADDLFEQLESQAAAQQGPPVGSWHPQRSGVIDIRIDHDGQWWHEGRRFQRDKLVSLFAQVMRREGNTYYLVTPVEKLAIQVADVPFLVVDMDVRGQQQQTDLLFTTNVGDLVVADQHHPLYMRNAVPYLMVRDGLEARLSRSVYYRLAQMVDLVDDKNGATYTVYSKGCAFQLDIDS